MDLYKPLVFQLSSFMNSTHTSLYYTILYIVLGDLPTPTNNILSINNENYK